MQGQIIEKTDKELKRQVAIILSIGLLTAILATFISRSFARFFGTYHLLSGLLIFLFVMAVAWGAVLIRARQEDKTKYILSENSLYVTTMHGLRGSLIQDTYRYESILSVQVKKTHRGRKHNFGNIELTIPKLGVPVTLHAIINPEKQADKIRSHIEKRSGGDSELVL